MNRVIITATFVVLVTIATLSTARADKVSTIPVSKVYTFEPMIVPRLAKLKKQAVNLPVADKATAEEIQKTLNDRKIVEDAVAKMNAIATAAAQERRNPIVAAEQANKEISAVMADLRKRKLDRGITPPTCKVER